MCSQVSWQSQAIDFFTEGWLHLLHKCYANAFVLFIVEYDSKANFNLEGLCYLYPLDHVLAASLSIS